MNPIQEIDLIDFIERNIPEFHRKRIDKITALDLKVLLERKNPYLFKAKNIGVANDFVKSVIEAYLSSQEETLFGEFLESLAIFICSRVYSGRKSTAEGIDLEFEKDGIVYIVSVKSGPHWGNSGQINRMKDNFKKAKRILLSNVSSKNIVAVNGCCYGKSGKEDQGDYLKKCGQSFWSFISGNDNLYLDIIEPLGHNAKKRNDDFAVEYDKTLNRITKKFIEEFCQDDGTIIWEKIVRINSARK